MKLYGSILASVLAAFISVGHDNGGGVGVVEVASSIEG